MKKVENIELDPSGIIDLEELNEISEINGGLVIEGATATILVGTMVIFSFATVANAATNYFSCGRYCE